MLCTVPCAPEPRLLALAPVSSWRTRHREPLGLFQSGVIKDRRKRCATAVGERVATVLAIVHNESTDGLDCIACARILTAAWSIPVPTQNRIMRSCAVSFVVAFAIAYSRRQVLANAP